MNLHICTISSRNDFLEIIYNSIPKNKDIIWHIAKSIATPVIDFNFIKDKRVKIHELTCDDTDTSFKMNYIFNIIAKSELNSYFCILDDDTIFHFNMYRVYLLYKNSKFLIIGGQMDKNHKVRLQGSLPYECAIDSGNVLCHSSILETERWGQHWDEKYHVDFEFWNSCFKHFTIKNTDVIHTTISIYNALNDKEDSLDYIRD